MWNSDNAIFNINGEGLERLRKTLQLAIGNSTIAGWRFKKDKGLVLYPFISSCDKDTNKFPSPLGVEALVSIIFAWLKTSEAASVPCEGWDADCDHDGSNELGWRVYTEDWGHVGEGTAIAVKPAYLWHGK